MKKQFMLAAMMLVLMIMGTDGQTGGYPGQFGSAGQLTNNKQPLLNRELDSCVINIGNARNVVPLITYTDHTNGAWNAVFSHDGSMLATCAQDGKVLVHVLSVPDSVIHYIGHSEWVLGLAFSADDQILASAGTYGFMGTLPGPIKIWDVATATQLRELPGHEGGTWCLDFQESTGILASCGKDGLVKLWDADTGDLLDSLVGHSGWVLSVDFYPTLNLIASSGRDHTVRIWDSQTGEELQHMGLHTENVGCVKFSPDGLYVASGSDDQTVRLWRVADGSEVWHQYAGQGWINGVAFSPSGEVLMTCGHDGSVVLRKTIDGTELVRLTAHTAPVLRGSFNPSGTLFATASWDSTVRVWGIDNSVDTDSDGIPDGCDFFCGDANGDGNMNIGDVVHIINYVFKGGAAPDPLCMGDADGDGDVNISDAVYLINYVFKSGPPPVPGCCM